MSNSPKKLWNELDAVFKSYNACFRTTIAPNFAPNYWLHVDQIFSAHGALQKEFTMSTYISPIIFFTSIITIHLKYMDSMFDEYVIYYNKSTKCPVIVNSWKMCAAQNRTILAEYTLRK